MKLLKTFCSSIFLLLTFILSSQSMDQLKIQLKSAKNDSIKTTILLEIIDICEINQIPEYAKQILSICDGKTSKFNQLSTANTFNNWGFYFSDKGQSSKALEYYYKSLIIYKKYNYLEGIGTAYGNIADVKQRLGEHEIALKYNYKSLVIREKCKDEDGISITYTNLGVIFDQQGQYDKALHFFEKALKLSNKTNNLDAKATNLNNIAHIYTRKKQYDKALQLFFESLKCGQLDGNNFMIGRAFENIGNVYKDKKEYKKASNYFEESLKIFENMDSQENISFLLNKLNTIYLLQGISTPEMEKNALKSYKISKKLNYPECISESSAVLKDLYATTGDYKKAYAFFKIEVDMNEKIYNENNLKETLKKSLEYDYDKKVLTDSIRHQEANKMKNTQLILQKKQLQQEKQQRFTLYIGLILLAIFLLVLFNRFKNSQKQKNIIENQKYLVEEKNKEITDSITYAKRIQSAILPSHKLIKTYFPESFILYKPKDIVAGDFYWFEVINNMIYFAAADCTGHGVPGAMVSVVCNNALNRSIKEYNLKSPGDILNKTREIVVQEFEKSNEDVKDGMDISLCVFEKDSLRLTWAGAHNPLWIYRNGEIIEFKADKQPIGKFEFAQPFTSHEIELQEMDEIYLFTDGFQDQFGGKNGKKFKTNQLRDLIKSKIEQNMDKKLEHWNLTFENWKGEFEQVDDVCVLGLKI